MMWGDEDEEEEEEEGQAKDRDEESRNYLWEMLAGDTMKKSRETLLDTHEKEIVEHLEGSVFTGELFSVLRW